ncbi:PAS domain S-box protein [Pedobacter frigiditerrae]|uniref:histidine kinase n=1 Tax=Pedobacter frigiditerrae TaxID=2530452 RepID=A0A4V6N5N3_9SPHI|nr:ATP-binding protein [Pedobacter frigiditerrae]TCC88076.1 PAS domain S-box protein [Pedobacter frigiditerrae]
MHKAPSLSNNQLLEILSFSKEAMAIYTTQDIVIEMANDAMLAFWGRDKSIIGLPLETALPELKGQPFIGMLQKVLQTGITDSGLAIPAELLIDGELQTSYFDYEYRAIKNELGETYCIFHTAADVTEKVLGMQAMELARKQETALYNEQALNEELAASNEELAAINEELNDLQEKLQSLNSELEERVNARTKELADSEARLRYMLADAPVAIAVFSGRDLVVESANKKVLEAWGKTDEIIGKPLHIGVPELVGQDFLTILDEVFTSSQPFYGNEVRALIEQNGVIEEVYSNFVYHPLKDDAGSTTSIMLVANVVTEQVKARKVIEESEQRFRFMLNAIPQQVWTATPDGALDYVNDVICADFGDSTAEIVGNGWQKYIHPEDLPKALIHWRNALETGTEYLVEFRLLFADGSYKWHLARALPFVEDGQIKSWIGTNTNIDVQKENEQKKDEFISIASHELKTPLTSVKAFNQLMSRTNDPEKLTKYISKSAEHITKLEKLITDLLDVTKINAGKMNYTMQAFDFTAMVKESIDNVQHGTNTHQIVLEQADAIEYHGDHFRLEQVMNNFLTNAIKYSPEGNQVLVNCKLENNNIIVSVKDFGVGIEEHSLDKLFDRYYRVDNTAMRFEGLGLGLFISSEILKRHQGSFWLESELGKGSTFYFRLPIEMQDDAKTIINTNDLYQDESIVISYDAANARVDVDWRGFQDLASVQNGGARIIAFLKRHQCTKACNDNTNVLGTWSEAVDWAGKEFFPMLEEAGLKHLAWIYPDSVFNKLSAKKTVDIAQGGIVTQFFTDLGLARNWLDSK